MYALGVLFALFMLFYVAGNIWEPLLLLALIGVPIALFIYFPDAMIMASLVGCIVLCTVLVIADIYNKVSSAYEWLRARWKPSQKPPSCQ